MTRKESREKRISDILDAAIPEFAEKGYEGASMESIAARAGLTKGGLYYHVKSKDDILVMANERFMEPTIRFMEKAMNATSAARGLAGYIRNYLTYWSMHPTELSFIFLTMTKTISDPNLRSLFRGYTGQMTAFFEGLYRKGVDSGEFRPVEVRSSALSLMGALDGIVGYLVVDDDLDLENTIRKLSETFIPVDKE
ncbi:MAG: TetR/AcrR family transcriptional regulator [Spirochaetes bacterium]|nr:TetR/AcrR family transcriptional regulator [Spirochaetota bacterium]